MDRAHAMARLAEIMAGDDRFGYSNKPPNGRWGPDFDCSSFLYFVAWLAGYPVGIGSGKVRFTGQMTKDFKDAGFELLPYANVGIGDLQIGDILLNLALHAEIYVGDGQLVGAQSAENGGYSGEAGDQTGMEIVKHPAYVYENDWDFVLRPPKDVEEDGVEEAIVAEEEGDEQDMAYPYSNSTMGAGNWMPQNAAPGYSRMTMPTGWMPPAMGGYLQGSMGQMGYQQGYPQGNVGQMGYQQGYPQGNVGQMNGYSQANANGYQQPGQQGYQQGNNGGYPQGGQSRHLIHVAELNETRDIHVNPGECVPVFIGDGKYMALKSADQEGFPNLRVFELHECTEEMGMQQGQMGQQGASQGQQPMMQQSQGVSREEFDQLKEMIANVQSAISASGFPQGNASSTVDASGNGANGNAKQANRSGRNA